MTKKYLLYAFLLITLNGCLQSSVSFIGPAYTVASTGNLYQAGLSVTVNQTLLHTTGENTLEYANRIIKDLENYKEKKLNKPNKPNLLKSKDHHNFRPNEVENNHQAFLNSVKSTIQIRDK